ncbi:MAG: ABC transporter ATP-binding protein [Clostridia bacterium]|nr:ABC transporter ATP-binding protein [Clostridia bacterium]
MKKNKGIWKWIYKNGKKNIPVILVLTAVSIFLSLIQIRFATASKSVMDIATGSAVGKLSSAFLLLASLLLIRLGVQILINYLNVHASSRFEIGLKRHLFKTLIGKDYLSVAKYHSGELLNRINSDVSVIVSGIIAIVPSAALFLTSIIGAFCVLYSIESTLAIIILCVGPLVAVGARLYSAKYKVMHKKCQEYDGKTKSFMLEILQNLLVVKSFACEEKMLDKSEDLQIKSYRLRVKRVTVSVIAQIGLFLIFNAGYYFAMAYAAYRLSQGELTYGDVTAILALVSQIQTPFKNVSGLVPQAFAVSASIERLMELENLKDESTVGETLPDNTYENMEHIVYDNVTFSYSDDSVVSGINMKINKGECVVIAGESGAGKSTAIKLLLGIMTPDSGRIYLDGKNGEIELGNNTRELFAYVPQGNLILSGTIRENIAFAKTDATEDEIIHAAKVAQIWSFIETLDKGLDTELGEKGLGLSEGQTQRISIARAILHDAPILLLDESTSALDSVTELELLRAIREMTDKTCIIVSHKQAAFDICDSVVYIEKKSRD